MNEIPKCPSCDRNICTQCPCSDKEIEIIDNKSEIVIPIKTLDLEIDFITPV